MAYTQNDPFNPVNTKPKPELGPNDYGKPMGKPLPRPERRQPGYSDGSGFDFNAWRAGKKRKPLPGQDVQGGDPMQTGPTLDAKPTPFPGPRGGLTGWPVQGGPHDYWGDGNGGAPAPGRFGSPPSKQNPNGTPGWDTPEWNKMHPGGKGSGQPPWLEGQMLPMDIGPGSANERAQSALKAQWEAKNGPWLGGGQGGPRDNNAGRLSQQAIANGLMDDRGYTGGNIKPGGMGPGGQDPMYGGAGTGPSYGGGPKGSPDVNYGAPVQRGLGAPPVGTGPGSMGKPQQPQIGGRQPLRPGMQYRPGGGQRPVGGMQGRPQDGGQSQPPPQYQQAWNDLQGQGMDPAQHAQWSNGQLPQGPAGGQDPNQMNAWRQKLMQMQKQGPNNNQYYGAF